MKDPCNKTGTKNRTMKTQEMLEKKIWEIVGSIKLHELLSIARNRFDLKQYQVTAKTSIPQSRQSSIENGSPMEAKECQAYLEMFNSLSMEGKK